jgi:sterol desaturase/sphingolipid hydroxylase (fatty acid hydroxylase superfamily)
MESKVIEKMPLYNLLNMLQVGATLVVGLYLLYASFFNHYFEYLVDVPAGYIVILSILAIFILYEIGYVIFRIGGTVVEYILKKTKAIKMGNYSKFNERKRTDENLAMLSREYAFARTQFTAIFILAIFTLFRLWWLGLIGLALSSIFIFTMIKHSKKINAVVEYVPQTPNIEKKKENKK